MRQRTWLAGCVLSVTLSGTLAVAQDAADAKDTPKARPGNGQGAAFIFKRLDANKDGAISKAEFAKVTEKLAERGKGKAAGMGGRLFERLDTNNNGSLSEAEFQKLQSLRGQGQGMRGKAAGGVGRQGRAGVGRRRVRP